MAVKYQSRSSKLTLAITSQPTTTQYIVGDTLDLSGMVIKATRRSGTTTVTSQCTFSPANGSTLSSSGTKTITITYQGKTITTSVSVYALSRIAVTTPPTKTSYNLGDTLSYSGMVIKAYANSDYIVRTVTSECTISPASGTTLSTTGSFNATITWRTKSTTQSYAVHANIYGAEWSGGSSTSWTRTDSASSFSNPSPAVNNGSGSSPFDNIQPWSGITRISESMGAAGTNYLVKIPKFYYKWTKSGSKLKLQICMTKRDGFSTSPAHANRGDGTGERDYVYVGAYQSAIAGGKAFSYTNIKPNVNATRATFRTYSHSTGTKYWQWDWAMLWTIRMLYLVEYADWDCQTKIGYGCGNNTEIEKTGLTNSMTYHTGTNASSRTTYGHVRYRYIEDLWANVEQFYDGIYFSGNNVYAILNPSSFSDTSGGTSVGTRATSSGDIRGFTSPTTSGYEWALFPNTVGSSNPATTYICDRYAYDASANFSTTGGAFDHSLNYGLFRENAKATTSSTYSNIGSRIMKLP